MNTNAKERSRNTTMTEQTHIIDFFDELLADIIGWMETHEETEVQAQGRAIGEGIAKKERMVPTAAIETVLRLLPDFIRARPGIGNSVAHLRKYFETVLRTAS